MWGHLDRAPSALPWSTREAGSKARRPRAGAQMRAAARRRLSERARRARREVVVIGPLLVGVILAYRYRIELFGADQPVRILCAIALVGLGWWFARDVGRAMTPTLFRRMELSTAG